MSFTETREPRPDSVDLHVTNSFCIKDLHRFNPLGVKWDPIRTRGSIISFSYYLHVRKSGTMGLRWCERSSACGQMVPTRLIEDQ